MVEAPTRNKKDRPTAMALSLVEVDEKNEFVRPLGDREIPIGEGPLILNLWQSPPPAILGEKVDPRLVKDEPWRHVESNVIDPILLKAAEELDVARVGFRHSEVNRGHYLRFLAKTAHAYAAAEFGIDAFEPFLLDLILNRSDDLHQFVGDMPGVSSMEGATEHSFKISLGRTPDSLGPAGNLICVFIQLWGDLGSPPHLVVVGRPRIDLDAAHGEVS
jgi:hypothetical protein